jgi:exoribonuclease R
VPSKTWFGRTVIRSCGKLAYGQAQTVIENPEVDWSTPGGEVPQLHCGHTAADVKGDILALHKIAQVLRRGRYSDGALRLNKPKLAFKLDDAMMPTECFPYITREANQLVEEFMLKANMAVAEHIAKAFPSSSLLRRHPPPLERKLEAIVKVSGVEMRGMIAE